MIKRIILCTVTIFAVTAAISWAQQQPSTGGHHPQEQAMGQQQDPNLARMPPWARNMPPEQQKQFQKIYEARTNKIYPLAMQIKAKQAQLKADLAQQNVNSEQVDQTLKQLNDLQAQLQRAQVDLMLEVKQQLPQVFMHFMMKGPGMGMMGGQGMDGMMGCPGMDGMMGGCPGMGGMMGGPGMDGMMGGCPGMGGMMGGPGMGMMGGHGKGMMGGRPGMGPRGGGQNPGGVQGQTEVEGNQ